MRKLQVVKESLPRTENCYPNLSTALRPAVPTPSQGDGEYEEQELRLRKELEAQKARIVDQMAPVREEVEGEIEEAPKEQASIVPLNLKAREWKRYGGALANRENVAPATLPPSKYGSLKGKDRPQVQAKPLQQVASRDSLMDKVNMRIGGLY